MIFVLLFFSQSQEVTEIKLIRSTYDDLWPKIKDYPNTIVFLTDNDDSVKFAYPAIEKYKDRCQYFLASPSEFPHYPVNTDPIIIYFRYNKTTTLLFNKPNDMKEFMQRNEYIVDHYRYILCPSLYPILFSGECGSLLVEVDYNDQSTDASDKETKIINKVSSDSLLSLANIKVDHAGLYSFRAQDRMMIEYNGSFDEQVESNLIHYSKIPLNSSKITFSFIIDIWGKNCTKQYDMLDKVANKYDKVKYDFSLIHISKAPGIIKGSVLSDMKIPFFIAFNNSVYPVKKWVYDEKIEGNLSFDSLCKFIDDIIENKKIPTVISENLKYDSSSYSVRPISLLNFENFVYNESVKNIVVFHSANCAMCKIVLTLIKGMAKISNENATKFYMFNTSCNDIPEGVPEIKRLPTIMAWKKGKNEPPIIYNGEFTFNEICNFLKGLSNNYVLPGYDKAKKSFVTYGGKLKNFIKNTFDSKEDQEDQL